MPITRTLRTSLALAMVLALASSATAEVLLSPMTNVDPTVTGLPKRVRRTKRFRLSRTALAELRSSGKTVLKAFPIGSDGTVDIEVTRYEPFTPNAHVEVVNGTTKRFMGLPDNAYFSGQVVGDPSSRVFIVAGRQSVRGMVAVGGEFYPFTPRNLEETESYALSDVDVGSYPPPACANDEHPEVDGLPAKHLQAMAREALGQPPVVPQVTSILQVDLAIDTDAEFRAKFASDLLATDYVMTLVAAASDIYRRDANVDLRVSSIRLFGTSPTSDPWVQNGSDLLDQLREVAFYWQGQGGLPEDDATHERADALMMLSGKHPGEGGIAYVSQVCNSQELATTPTTADTWAVAVSQVNGAFKITSKTDQGYGPGSIWDLFVFTHEIGHVLGSPHTVDYSPPVDRCPEIWSSGTIMSACHHAAGNPTGLANIKLQFDYAPNGPVSQRIRTTSEQASCLQPVPGSGCGDGETRSEEGEACDDGNTQSNDGCSSTCQIEPIPDGCGDGVKSDTEGCDDGNNAGGDGCSRVCTLEPCVATVPEQTNWDDARVSVTPTVLGDKVKIRGHFGIATGTAVDPDVNGVRLLLEDAAGNVTADVVVPGGPNWIKIGSHVWRYRDRLKTVHGVRAIRVQTYEYPGRLQVRVSASADGAEFGDFTTPASLPMTITSVVDNTRTGACGRFAFGGDGASCTLAKNRTAKCAHKTN